MPVLNGAARAARIAELQERSRRRSALVPVAVTAQERTPKRCPAVPSAACYLTPQQVAAELQISAKTAIRRFAGHPLVLNLGGDRRPTEKDPRTTYSMLRTPREAYSQFGAAGKE